MNIWRKEYFEQTTFELPNVLFIGNNIAFVLAKAKKDLSSQRANSETITNLFSMLSVLLFLSIRSSRSAGNYKVATRRFLPFPVEMRRGASVKIRFDVFTDKPLCKSEESDNKLIVLFRWGNSPTIYLFLFSFVSFYKERWILMSFSIF